jgi:hypothetical protein
MLFNDLRRLFAPFRYVNAVGFWQRDAGSLLCFCVAEMARGFFAPAILAS